MSEKLDAKKCSVCDNEECTCENIEVCLTSKNEECVCEDVSDSIRRTIQIDFEEYPESFCECDCECDCNEECEDECMCDKKKSLTILGATVATVAVAGGILYLVKRKK